MAAARGSVFSWHRLVAKANAADELGGAVIIAIRWGRQQGATTLTDDDMSNWVFRLEQALATLVDHDGEPLAPRPLTLAVVQAHLAIKSIVRDAALRAVGTVTLKAYKSAAISVRDAVACCLGAAVGIASHKAYSTAFYAAYGGAVQNDRDLHSQLLKAYYHFFRRERRSLREQKLTRRKAAGPHAAAPQDEDGAKGVCFRGGPGLRGGGGSRPGRSARAAVGPGAVHQPRMQRHGGRCRCRVQLVDAPLAGRRHVGVASIRGRARLPVVVESLGTVRPRGRAPASCPLGDAGSGELLRRAVRHRRHDSAAHAWAVCGRGTDRSPAPSFLGVGGWLQTHGIGRLHTSRERAAASRCYGTE